MNGAARRARADEIYQSSLYHERATIDRLFAALLLVQWAIAIVLALGWSSAAWAGRSGSPVQPLNLAVFLGGAINALPMVLAWRMRR